MTAGPANTSFHQKKLSILQIGDIHYPELLNATSRIDLKSDPFNAKSALAPAGHLFEDVVRLLMNEARNEIDAMVFVGDFTTAGDLVAYEAFTKKLAQDILPAFFNAAELSNRVIVVAGNHDVDWPSCLIENQRADDFVEKFSPFKDILARYGIANFPLIHPCAIKVGGDAQVNLFGINSCLGCGELRLFPESVRNDLRKQLNDALRKRKAGTLSLKDMAQMTERLDAPLISKASLSAIDAILFDRPAASTNIMDVIVGHHNLLPQLTPRIAPFAELMNAGQLRAILSSKDYPIIYLHGHIHDDPIEVVVNQSNKTGGIYSISAPEFHRGFNKLTFWFNGENQALGTEILPIRIDENGVRKRLQSIKIPYHFGPTRFSRMSPLARRILGNASARQPATYFGDLCAAYSKETDLAVFHALHELAWIDAVQIDNYDRAPQEWFLRFSI
jgi:3',5'-cyclic AMP phosphodiesterase CpdA